MTERLYYDNAYLMSFDAQVLTCRPNGAHFDVLLDRSAFYPTSGGQPFDTGTLGDAHVLDVNVSDGEVWHTVDTPLNPGDTVHGQINWARRFDHMQQHAGDHMIASALHRLMGGVTIGLHISDDVSTIDVAMPGGATRISDEDIRRIEADVNERIQRDVPIRCWFPDEAELAALPLRKQPTVNEHVRIVAIGEDEMVACGGTHPSTAGQLGLVKILSVTPARGKMRVAFLAGQRALTDYARCSEAAHSTAELLSTGVEQLTASVAALQEKLFDEMVENKFSILEDVKEIKCGNKYSATLSIGVGYGGQSLKEKAEFARAAVTLALGRGGDQSITKEYDNTNYFGGKSREHEKTTRVKARVKAEALREFITVKDNIFVMGHCMTDVDSFGAAIGIYRAAAALGKKAHIIVNEVSASLRPLYNCYIDDPNYPDDMILTSAQALEMADEKSMVVVVDTNRPQMTECPELLKVTKTIVVLDHHRQSSDNIDNALLSYIEPYASSACEMVSEILQYIVDDIKIPNLESSSLYAGIMIDTNYFVNKTGVRTFEAAAFLRRHGADLTLVRKMFRDDMDAYRAKAEIISSAEVYHDKYAIASGAQLNVESPTIVGAQAANELLDISGIKASFVFTEYNEKIYISARSIDEVNVQVIMERLGGGGHMNASGAQFNHTDMKEAIATLKELIDQMTEEGDL